MRCQADLPPRESVICQSCLSRHHPGCWDVGATCASCGSQGRLELAPRPRPRRCPHCQGEVTPRASLGCQSCPARQHLGC